MIQSLPPYYADKVAVLANLFEAKQVVVGPDYVAIDGRRFPVIDDVIVLLEPDYYSKHVVETIGTSPTASSTTRGPFATDVQYTFGEEWQAHPEMLTEHEEEFRQYFDLIDIDSLAEATICDLGCGSGRWSYYLRQRCRQLILVDFSDAIFVARRNLHDCANALFFLGDLTNLPFRRQCADLVICLGVLHHLPIPALQAVRGLKDFAPRILVYLYYALDNRPVYFRVLLVAVTGTRRLTSRIRGSRMRGALSGVLTLVVYVPLVSLGKGLDAVGLGKFVPLYETYRARSIGRIRQDVYDRFFTRIEQRVTRASIMRLEDTFASVTVSPHLPYWHFLCESAPRVGAEKQFSEQGGEQELSRN
jgi:SAM-dependent methyltransferase